MSVPVSSAVWEHSRARGADRLVLLDLAERASADGVAWPSREEIERRTKTKNVSRSIGVLERLGELEVRYYLRGRTRLNVYRVTLPGVAVEVDYARLEEKRVLPDRPFTTLRLVTPSDGDDVTPRIRRGYEASPPARASLIGEPSGEPPVDQERSSKKRDAVGGARRAREAQASGNGSDSTLFEADPLPHGKGYGYEP